MISNNLINRIYFKLYELENWRPNENKRQKTCDKKFTQRNTENKQSRILRHTLGDTDSASYKKFWGSLSRVPSITFRVGR